LLNGKVALVTGASKGIGFEIAREFAKRGARVVLCSRKKSAAQRAADLIHGVVLAEQLDITDAASVRKLVASVKERYGRVDILANNAGYPYERQVWYKGFHDISDDDLDRIIEVDLKGTARISRAVIPLMIKQGGVIISISSTPSISGYTEGAPYTLAKSAIIAMTKHIALEYGQRNIRAYTLALGNIASEATYGSMTPAERKKAAKENAMKRWGDPREVATIAASIASDDFAFATGNTIVIDGGTVLL
jgi:NAD(P)-dependent dehydrogenase (short-subunit alcohol dehydrogenase family)